jgi:hypothetical protein
MNIYESISQLFESREVKLNAGASEEVISLLCKSCALNVDSRFLDLYRTFDGFFDDDFDSNTFISIWPIEKIVNSRDFGNLHRKGFLPFADFSFSSAEYAIPYSNLDQSIVIIEPFKSLHVNFNSFCDRLLSKQFDFGLGIT